MLAILVKLDFLDLISLTLIIFSSTMITFHQISINFDQIVMKFDQTRSTFVNILTKNDLGTNIKGVGGVLWQRPTLIYKMFHFLFQFL